MSVNELGVSEPIRNHLSQAVDSGNVDAQTVLTCSEMYNKFAAGDVAPGELEAFKALEETLTTEEQYALYHQIGAISDDLFEANPALKEASVKEVVDYVHGMFERHMENTAAGPTSAAANNSNAGPKLVI